MPDTPTPKAPDVAVHLGGDDGAPAVVVYFGGGEYSSDDLTFADICELEEAVGSPIEEIDWSFKRAILTMVWLVRRRNGEDELTLEEVGAVGVRDLRRKAGDDGRPTGAPSGGAPTTSAESGSPGSPSTVSGPGSSDS